MIQQQMMEVIRRHTPELNESEIRSRMNDASDMYCEETRILEGQWSFTTQPDQMYYDMLPGFWTDSGTFESLLRASNLVARRAKINKA